jgi:hypothetical protein
MPGYTSTAAGIFPSLLFNRVVTVDLNSGRLITGALAEGPDSQPALFETWSKGSLHYHVIPPASTVAWPDMRGEGTNPLFLYNRQYLTQRKIRQENSGAGG